MAKFIRVHNHGTEVLVNVDYISEVQAIAGQGTCLVLHSNPDDPLVVDEVYRKVQTLIGNATGGIGGID